MIPTATLASCYKQFSEIPNIVSGRIARSEQIPRYDYVPEDSSSSAQQSAVTLITSQADLKTSTTLKFSQHYSLSSTSTHHHPTNFPSELPARHKLTAISSTGRRRAIVTSATDKDTQKIFTNTIEIFHNDKRALVHDGEEYHGDIHTSGPFSGMVWSPDETKVVYVAEASAVPKHPLYPKKKKQDANLNLEDERLLGEDYEYKEHFGELCESYRNPSIFVLTVDTGDLLCIDAFSSNQFPGRPVWLPSSAFSPHRSSLVLTVWESFPSGRRPGMIFYSSRRSSLVTVELSDANSHGDAVQMTSIEKSQSACDPRFSPDGRRMIYLTSISTALHGSTMSLKMLTCNEGSDWYGCNESDTSSTSGNKGRVAIESTVIDVPRGNSSKLSLYVSPGTTPNRIWIDGSRYVVLASKHRSLTNMILVDTLKSTCHRIEIPRSIATQGTHRASYCQVLDVYGRRVLWKMSAAHRPDSAFVLTFGEVGDNCFQSISWSRVSLPSSPMDRLLCNHITSIHTRVFDVQPINHDDDNDNDNSTPGTTDNSTTQASSSFEAVLMSLAKEEDSGDANMMTEKEANDDCRLPYVILYPHGGPHSQSFVGYSPEIAVLTLFGFAVLHVNYRGSLGFGKFL